MNANRTIRRAASAALLAGLSVLLPRALEACTSKGYYTEDDGWVQEISCCGGGKCCTTVWSGSTLLRQECRP